MTAFNLSAHVHDSENVSMRGQSAPPKTATIKTVAYYYSLITHVKKAKENQPHNHLYEYCFILIIFIIIFFVIHCNSS